MNANKSDIRLANLLGAFALALSDRLTDISEQSTGQTASVPAALIQLGSFANGSMNKLQSSLAASQPNTTRTVQKMEHAGLVNVASNTGDKRGISVQLTPMGELLREKALQARESELLKYINALTESQKEVVQDFLQVVLKDLTPDRASSDFTCRYCDLEACPQDVCPAEPNNRCTVLSG